jgi:2-amino-4-hydroxy-6-hydroxymethyldihydropteridine diphosphokinase
VQPSLVTIALGSNVGDRAGQIARAVGALRALPGLHVEAVSSLIETPALRVGEVDPGGAFLNAVLIARTIDSPEAILARLQTIEASLGRDRSAPRGSPRTIDLDLLLHGSLIQPAPELTLPHPGLTQREFVLAPLAEIAPDLVVPGTGRSVRAHLDALRARAGRPSAPRLAALACVLGLWGVAVEPEPARAWLGQPSSRDRSSSQPAPSGPAMTQPATNPPPSTPAPTAPPAPPGPAAPLGPAAAPPGASPSAVPEPRPREGGKADLAGPVQVAPEAAIAEIIRAYSGDAPWAERVVVSVRNSDKSTRRDELMIRVGPAGPQGRAVLIEAGPLRVHSEQGSVIAWLTNARDTFCREDFEGPSPLAAMDKLLPPWPLPQLAFMNKPDPAKPMDLMAYAQGVVWDRASVNPGDRSPAFTIEGRSSQGPVSIIADAKGGRLRKLTAGLNDAGLMIELGFGADVPSDPASWRPDLSARRLVDRVSLLRARPPEGERREPGAGGK